MGTPPQNNFDFSFGFSQIGKLLVDSEFESTELKEMAESASLASERLSGPLLEPLQGERGGHRLA